MKQILKKALKKSNKSYTGERQAFFDFIVKNQHFTIQEAQEKLGISRASVFRTLALFERLFLVKKIDKNAYEFNNPAKHHEHLKCNKCGQLFEIDDHTLHSQIELLCKKYNFSHQEHQLIIYGICKKCQERD
ncbi:MAG: transcriptional repressor [Candidatus Gracilibacteria bacterium]|jgi:Fur family ferric uptake transcriptional regulator|nr:transcriptional repressor [Candidatus Gracilibacteria bacterium]